MKIRGWRVKGFGHFTDYDLNDLSEGVNVLLGPNEAGKSTLLAYIRGMLFGFPSGNTSEPKYPTAPGVAHGGQLLLESDGDDFVIERYSGKRKSLTITLADGTPENEEWL